MNQSIINFTLIFQILDEEKNEGFHKTFSGTTKKCKNKNLT